MKAKDFFIAALFVAGSIGFGSIGTVFTAPAITTWYAALAKPAFNPPNFIFGPVWTILFILIGIAAYLVWQKGWKNPNVKSALVFFAIQFVFNIAWGFFFFGLKNPLLGLVDIVILWVLITLTIWRFYQVSRPAAVLLVPYLIWVSFATILNFSIWKLN